MITHMLNLPVQPPIYPDTASLPTGAVAGTQAVVLSTPPTIYVYDGVAWQLVAGGGATTVSSVTGTVNQITASPSTGDVVLSLPQDIAFSSEPRFSSIRLTDSATVGYLWTCTNATTGEGTWQLAPTDGISQLTGDVTAVGPGSAVATIALHAVAYDKIQQIAASTLIGNPTALTANAQGVTLGASLTFSGSTLNTIQQITTGSAPTFAGITLSSSFIYNNGALTGYFLRSANNSGFGEWKPISAYAVTDVTGTANQVLVDGTSGSPEVGSITLSLPQDIATSSAVQFGSLGIGSTVPTSAIVAITSTTSGFLLPRMTTTQRNLISTPATGLQIYNTTTNDIEYYNGISWVGTVSSGVTSATGTANQVLINGTSGSAQTGALTFTLPQSIATSSVVQFGTLGLGASIVTSSILSLTSTTAGFLLPRMTTTQRDAIATPATGLQVYNTTTNDVEYYNGSSWVGASGSGVTSITGTTNQVIASSSTGSVTLSLPQSIATSSTVQFGVLSLGSSALSSAILTLTSTLSGFLPPRMTTTQRNAISSPAEGLVIYNSTVKDIDYYNGTAWTSVFTGGVTSITGTANQVIASAATGAVTLSLPQSIATSSAVQFATLGLGSAVVASSILSITSTTAGFLPPRMTTTQKNAISSPATGLIVFDTTIGEVQFYNGSSWVSTTGTGVTSITGTTNQVIASASTGAVTLSLPQSIATSSAVQFGTLGLGSSIVASSILSLTSTTLGFLPPRMTTTQKNAISSPATGLVVYDSTLLDLQFYNGSSWISTAPSTAGVTSLTGTAAQVLVNGTSGSAQTGALTLTLPQNISTTSLVQFANLGLGVAPTANETINIQKSISLSTGNTGYGIAVNNPIGVSSGTGVTRHVWIWPDHTNNSGGTISTAHGLFVDAGTTTGTITNGIGLQVKNPGYGSTIQVAAFLDNLVVGPTAVNPPSNGALISGKTGIGVTSVDTNALTEFASSSYAFTTKYSAALTQVTSGQQAHIWLRGNIQPTSGNTGVSSHLLCQGFVVIPSGQTVNVASSVFLAQDYEFNSGTMTNAAQLWIGTTSTTAGTGTIVNNYGARIEAPASGTGTGFRIATWTQNLCVNMNGFTATDGMGYFNTGVSIGTSTAPTTGGIMLNSGYIESLSDIRLKPRTAAGGSLYLCPDATLIKYIQVGTNASAPVETYLEHVLSTSGSPLKSSHPLYFQGGYWNGVTDFAYDYSIATTMTATTPAGRLSIFNDNVVEIASFVSITTNNSGTGLSLYNYSSDTNGPYILFRGARGTPASPTAIQLGDYLGAIGWTGYGTSTYPSTLAVISASATNNWTNTSTPVTVDFILPGINQVTGSSRFALIPNVSGCTIQVTSSTFNVGTGSNVASATNLTPTPTGNCFLVTGTTTCQNMVYDIFPGSSIVTLEFQSAGCRLVNLGSITSNYLQFKLSGNVDYVSTAGGMIVLQRSPSGYWKELSRCSY